MPERDSAQIAEWYDKLARGYDELYEKEQSSKYDAALNAVVGHRFRNVVDVGCGTGLFIMRLRLLCDFVVGVDVSREMLDRARRRVGDGSVGFVRADCSALPIRESITDCVFTISLLRVGTLMSKQLSELARILFRGGMVVGTVFGDCGEKGLPNTAGLESDPVFWDLSAREFVFRARRAML